MNFTERPEPADRLGRDALREIIAAVASKEGVEPLELTPPLAEVVDPDAIDTLLEGDSSVRITFEYHGCRIDVRSREDITVSDLETTT